MRYPTGDSIVYNSTHMAKDKMDMHSTTDIETELTTPIQRAPQSQMQKKRRTRYRAHQRVDGVITEYPRYLPAFLQSKPAFKFEKHIMELNTSTLLSKSKTVPKLIGGNSQDLLGISTCKDNIGRDGYNKLVNCGRGGYNGLLSDIRQENVNILGHQGGSCMTPMQRFLSEPGPWSAYRP